MALSPKPDGGNCLAILLASAAASLQRQEQLQQQHQLNELNHHNQTQKNQSTKQRSSRPHGNHKQQSPSQTQQQQPQQQNGLSPLQLLLAKSKAMTPNKPIDGSELRTLESWHDEDAGPTNESCLLELVDPSSNSNGWSADEMFKYNEKRHKIITSYSEKTLSDKYTTPLPKSSKNNARMADQLAAEIEERNQAEGGRITPESSDDDELFEKERNKRIQMKQKKQLDQLKDLHRKLQQQQCLSSLLNNVNINNNNDNSINMGKNSRTQSSSKHSNSTETPATASLSSSPILNEPIIMKPVTSSSRNILRACLT